MHDNNRILHALCVAAHTVFQLSLITHIYLSARIYVYIDVDAAVRTGLLTRKCTFMLLDSTGVGMYFAFLEFYTKFLRYPALAGIALFLR